MPNPFDQFDAPSGANPFDQFDQARPQQAGPSKTREALKRVMNYLNPVGTAEFALNLASGAVAQPVAGIAGLVAGALPGGTPAADVVNNVSNAMTYQPRTEAGQMRVGDLGRVVEPIERLADSAGDAASDSPLASTAVKTTLLAAPMLLGRGAGRVTPKTPPRMPAPKAPAPKPQAAPSVEQLKAQSSAAYKAAEDAGVVISKDAMARIAKEIKDELANEGIDADLHPQALAALKRLQKAGESHTSLKGAEILRRVIKDAGATPTNPANGRIAGIMRDAFDERIDSLTAADVLQGNAAGGVAKLQTARDLYQRARKGEIIEELLRRAELSAPNFSASGMENAIRTEFRNLAKNERRMRGFTKAERAAIEKVAKGGPIENTLRMLGKFAPTGVVSGALSGGLGFLAGGPAGAALLPAAGGVARAGAATLTKRNALAASEMVRRGQPKNALSMQAPKNALIERPRNP